MKKFILNLAVMVLCSVGHSSYAQDQDQLKAQIVKLTGTDFFRSFDSVSQIIETSGQELVINKQNYSKIYSEEKFKEFSSSYDQTTLRMNDLLKRMSSDLSSKKQLKVIRANPEAYAKGYLYDLDQISKDFRTNFIQPKLKYESSINIASNPMWIFPMIGMIKEWVQQIIEIVKAKKQARADQIQKFILDEHKVQSLMDIIDEIKGKKPTVVPNGQ